MSDHDDENERQTAAAKRFETLVEAFDYPAADDEEAMQELWFARRRISELVTMKVNGA